MNELTMLPNVCCIANPIISENTANEARTPNNSIPSSERARYNPPNQITALRRNTRSGFPPDTVTADCRWNLLSISGKMNLTVTLASVAAKIMNMALNSGAPVSAQPGFAESIHNTQYWLRPRL